MCESKRAGWKPAAGYKPAPQGRVMAPSEAEETSAQYLAKTPVL